MKIIKFRINNPGSFHLTLQYTQHNSSVTTHKHENCITLQHKVHHFLTFRQSAVPQFMHSQILCYLKFEQCNLRTWPANYFVFVCTVKLLKLFEDNVWSERSRCQENFCKATVRTAYSLFIFASLVSYTISSKLNVTDRHAEYVSIRYEEYCFFICV